jgi:hypothetical protein
MANPNTCTIPETIQLIAPQHILQDVDLPYFFGLVIAMWITAFAARFFVDMLKPHT